jgi:uncharacterized membrane protein
MRRRIVALLAFCTDIAVVALLWPRFPERVPAHYDFQGRVDRYGSKLELLLLGPALILGTWLLLELTRLVDPRWLKRRPAEGGALRSETEGAREIVECVLIWFMAVLHLGMLLLAAGIFRESARVLAVLVDTFVVVLGNFIGRLRPNWFIGIRTPWTLSSDDVWRRTHRLAARLMVALGLLLLPLLMILPERVALGASLAVLLGAGLLPAAWSYVCWRRAAV